MKIKNNKFWQNTIKKYGGNMPYYAVPKTIDDLAALVLRAESEGARIRAVGSGHSFSDVALPQIYLVSLKKLDRLLPLDINLIKSAHQDRNLVHVQGGMTIQRFNRLMKRRNLCVANMGGIDEQTLAGAVSTGTHGTGLDLPSFPGMVLSMVLVTKGGAKLRIEPADGISDPSVPQADGVELVQDDRKFYSALVGLGCFGLIYSFILELEDMYYLHESKSCYQWEEIKPKLLDRSLFYEDENKTKPYRGIMVQVNPYSLKDRGRATIVVRHTLLMHKPEKRTLLEKTRNWFSSIAGRLPITYWIARYRARRKAHKLPKTIDKSLRALKDKEYINRGYRVMYQGVEFIKTRAYDSEFAFDMSDGNNDVIDALEAMFELAEENKQRNHYQSAPMGLRFVGPSQAYLSPEYHRQVSYIDTPFILGTPHSDDILSDYQQIMTEHNGIPHWGKINTILNGRPEHIRKHFPKLQEWQEAYREFNANGTFSNAFSDRLHLGHIGVGGPQDEIT